MSSFIKSLSVDLGMKTVRVPVAFIQGKSGGKTLLVTGGEDGDEYASIDAAYKIIEEYQDKRFHGTLIVIPILNIPGFESVTSHNPQDGKYPKHVFPGKENGSSTERLMHWVYKQFVGKCDVWVNMHGGSITEMLEPYIYTYETKNASVNDTVRSVISAIDVPRLLFREIGIGNRVDMLAGKKIAYFFTEAGHSGRREEKWVNMHVQWVKTVMNVLGMIKLNHKRKDIPRVYRKVASYLSPATGLWYPSFSHVFVKKGTLLGEVRSYEGKKVGAVKAGQTGEFLWGKEGLYCKKGECVVEICFDRYFL